MNRVTPAVGGGESYEIPLCRHPSYLSVSHSPRAFLIFAEALFGSNRVAVGRAVEVAKANCYGRPDDSPEARTPEDQSFVVGCRRDSR